METRQERKTHEHKE